MRHVLAILLVSCLCFFAQPVSAGNGNKGKSKTIAEIEKDQIEQRIRYLIRRTDKLENRVRRENKSNHAQSAKRIDRDYLSKLEKVARRGDVDLWDRIYHDYMRERAAALADDKRAYEAKQAKKRENPWYNEPRVNN